MLGICVFDVYGMALILLHQSGAKLMEDYEGIDKWLISDIIENINVREPYFIWQPLSKDKI
jgi:hypothetical protein